VTLAVIVQTVLTVGIALGVGIIIAAILSLFVANVAIIVLFLGPALYFVRLAIVQALGKQVRSNLGMDWDVPRLTSHQKMIAVLHAYGLGIVPAGVSSVRGPAATGGTVPRQCVSAMAACG